MLLTLPRPAAAVRSVRGGEAAQVHLTRRQTARFRHVARPRHVDGDLAAAPRLRVAGGEGGGEFFGLPR